MISQWQETVDYYLAEIFENKKIIKKNIYLLIGTTFLTLIVYLDFIRNLDEKNFGFNNPIYLLIGITSIVIIILFFAGTFFIQNIISLKTKNFYYENQILLNQKKSE